MLHLKLIFTNVLSIISEQLSTRIKYITSLTKLHIVILKHLISSDFNIFEFLLL